MRKFLRSVLSLGLIIPLLSFALPSYAAEFVEGKDYKILQPTTAPVSPSPIGKVQVIEFFSYECPACNRLEPSIEKWLARGVPSGVVFERTPVVFHPEWDILARAYYIAKDLGVEKKITPAMFKAIHQQGVDMSTLAALSKFFVSQGVPAADFDNAMQFSPGLDAQMMRGENLMGVYKVFEIPTLVIGGKYATSFGMAKGDGARMMAIADFLIAKARVELSKK